VTGSTMVPGTDMQRARAYVLAHGDIRAQARLTGILDGARPGTDVVRTLEHLQGADGSFGDPFGTCGVLAEMKDMPPLAGSPMASRAVAYLRREQRTDGTWEPGPGQVDPVAVTAAATYTLLAFDSSQMDPIVRGSSWLRRALGSGDQGVQYLPTPVLASAAAIWYRLLGPAAQEVAWCFAGMTDRRLTASQLTGWLSAALDVGVGGRFAVPVVAWLSQLAQTQQADGSWESSSGAEPAVETTLQALRVLRGYGVG